MRNREPGKRWPLCPRNEIFFGFLFMDPAILVLKEMVRAIEQHMRGCTPCRETAERVTASILITYKGAA